MSFLYRRGKGAERRVMHLSRHNRSGNIVGPMCGRDGLNLNTSINVPLGRPVCKDCRKEAARDE